MQATGIVRRIDDLGRVVIPKEIRRLLGIKEGDPLEIFVDKNTEGISFRKYDDVGPLTKTLGTLMAQIECSDIRDRRVILSYLCDVQAILRREEGGETI